MWADVHLPAARSNAHTNHTHTATNTNRFITALPSSSASSPHQRRLYKTGDLVKWATAVDGTRQLLYLGRTDHQVSWNMWLDAVCV